MNDSPRRVEFFDRADQARDTTNAVECLAAKKKQSIKQARAKPGHGSANKKRPQP